MGSSQWPMTTLMSDTAPRSSRCRVNNIGREGLYQLSEYRLSVRTSRPYVVDHIACQVQFVLRSRHDQPAPSPGCGGRRDASITNQDNTIPGLHDLAGRATN